MGRVRYHLNNFRRNSAYCLPSSLRPTLIQRTVDHGTFPNVFLCSLYWVLSYPSVDSIIDEIPHPEIRNRMILMKGEF